MSRRPAVLGALRIEVGYALLRMTDPLCDLLEHYFAKVFQSESAEGRELRRQRFGGHSRVREAAPIFGEQVAGTMSCVGSQGSPREQRPFSSRCAPLRPVWLNDRSGY